MIMEGYDVTFEKPLDKRFECPICLLAQRDPMQTPCGHRYCGCCIIRALNETGLRCPIDNMKCIPNQLFRDNYAKREVLSLFVYCNGVNDGCVWKGELRHLKDHLKHCEYAVSPCANGCSFKGRRKTMTEHLQSCPNRSMPCPFCKVLFPRTKTQVHEANCSKYIVPNRFIKGIEKKNENLKWCGKMKWSLRGPQFEMGTSFSVASDSEHSDLCTANWHGVLNLIPLLEPQAKVFFSIICVNRHSMAQMNFHIIEKDSGTVCFENCIKNQVTAFMCPVVKSASGPNWVIMSWDSVRRRVVCHLVEIRGHVLKQLLLKLRQQKDSRGGQGSRQAFNRPQRANTAPHIPSVQFTPHVLAAPHAHITQSYTQGHPSTLPLDPRVNFEGHLPVLPPPTFPAWCSLPAGTAAPGGGSFFTFSTAPSQYLPTHWHPMGAAAVPHCQLFKHVAATPVRGVAPPMPYANFPLTDMPTAAAIIPPIVIGDVGAHVPLREEDLANIPGPSRLGMLHTAVASHHGETSRQAAAGQQNPFFRAAAGGGLHGQHSRRGEGEVSSGEVSPSHTLLSALRGIRNTSSSSSNSSPVMSPFSSSASNSSVASPSSDTSGGEGWNSPPSAAENSPREDFSGEREPHEADDFALQQQQLQRQQQQQHSSHSGAIGDSLPLLEIQQRIRRSRSGNFYLSSHGVPSALEELANAATVLEGRLLPHRHGNEPIVHAHHVPLMPDRPTIASTVIQVPLAQESLLQPSLFPSLPVFVSPTEPIPANVAPPMPHLAAPIPLAMPHPHPYAPPTWPPQGVHHPPLPPPPLHGPPTAGERARNAPNE